MAWLSCVSRGSALTRLQGRLGVPPAPGRDSLRGALAKSDITTGCNRIRILGEADEGSQEEGHFPQCEAPDTRDCGISDIAIAVGGGLLGTLPRRFLLSVLPWC